MNRHLTFLLRRSRRPTRLPFRFYRLVIAGRSLCALVAAQECQPADLLTFSGRVRKGGIPPLGQAVNQQKNNKSIDI